MSPRTVRRALVVIVASSLAAVVGVASSLGSASASSPLAAASPGPDAVVGGTIGEIELIYGELVDELDVVVTGPDGVELDAQVDLTSSIAATVHLARPLSTPGEYTVDSTVTSAQGERSSASYRFEYRPDAPGPQMVFVTPATDDERSWLPVVAGGIGAVVIAVLAWRLAASVRRARAAGTSRR